MKRQSGVKRLIGVGVGPGDPELVTVKAVRVLREADTVLVPVLAGTPEHPESAGPGRAEAIIRAYVGADRIRRLEFALNDTGGVTPRRAAAWQAAAAAVAEEFAAGAASVAFGTLGDPNLYSTFSYLAQTVRELVADVTVETVAGITAMQDLASRAGLSLAEGTEPVTLVPLNGGVAALDQALARGGTVVGYKVGAAASPAPAVLAGRLQAAGRLDAAVIGARLGLEGELIAPAAELLRPTPGFNESDSLPNRFGRESRSLKPYCARLVLPSPVSLSSPWNWDIGRSARPRGQKMRYRIGIGNGGARAGGDMMDSAVPAKGEGARLRTGACGRAPAGRWKGTNVADHPRLLQTRQSQQPLELHH